MTKPLTRHFIACILGFVSTVILMIDVIYPSYAPFEQNLSIELFVLSVFVFASFALGFAVLFYTFKEKEYKYYSIVAFLFPVFLTILSIGEKADTAHPYYDFWIIFIGSILTTLVAFLGAFMNITDYLRYKKELENKKTHSTSPNNQDTKKFINNPPVFEANEELTKHMNSVIEQMKEAKGLFTTCVKTLYEIEKLEQLLFQSQGFYMAISENHKQKADEKLKVLLSIVEGKMEDLFSEYDKVHLEELDKILLKYQ